MALELSGYIDDRGNEYPASYWKAVQITISVVDQAASALFYGYRDKAAADAGKASIGQKFFAKSGPDFMALYQKELALVANLTTLVYGIAKTEQPQGEASVDTEGKAVDPFFSGAKDV